MSIDVAITARATATLTVTIASGWLFDYLGVPLGWLIGAMLAMALGSLMRLPVAQPTLVIPYVRASVGTLLGASVTLEVIQSIPQWWISLGVMFTVLTLVGRLNRWLLRRWLGFAPLDATLCAMPGGIAEMILLGEQSGADARRVAIVHAMRIALSILLIPPLVAGLYGIDIQRADPLETVAMGGIDWFWFGLCVLAGVAADRWLRMIPLPFILVPLTLCAALHLSGLAQIIVPETVTRAIQVIIGMNVGARFKGITPAALAQVAGAAVMVVLTQMSVALLAALGVGILTGFDRLALTLAFAPGGLAEMSLIAIAMGRDVAFVGFHHILRVLFSLALAPWLLRRQQT